MALSLSSPSKKCPKCGRDSSNLEVCDSCGAMFAKIRARQAEESCLLQDGDTAQQRVNPKFQDENSSSWLRVLLILGVLLFIVGVGVQFARSYFIPPSLGSLIAEHRTLTEEAEQATLLAPAQGRAQLAKIGREAEKLKAQLARLPQTKAEEVQARRIALAEANSFISAASRMPAEKIAATMDDKASSNPLVLAAQKIEFAAKGSTGREAPGEVLDLSEAEFDSTVLASGDLFIVDFWAPWCGPCKMFSPIVEDVAREYGDRVRVAKVNTDNNPQLAQRYGASAIPLMVIFKGGKEQDRTVGALPREALIQEISKYL